MIAIVLLATSFQSVSATYTYIAGYEPKSTVTEHAEIDLDMKDIIKHKDWPDNNGGAYKDCTTIANACKWNTNMYPTLWDTTCTHYLDIPTTKVDDSAETIEFTAHGLLDGDKVEYRTGDGAAIGGLEDEKTYFVVSKTANTFKLSLSSGGSAIDITGNGNAAQSFRKAKLNTAAACTSPYGIYTDGKNSLKSTEVRNILGFASSIGTKASGPTGAKVAAKDNQFIGAMNTFWKSKGLNELTWGKDIIEAAFKGEKVKDGAGAKTRFDFGVVGRDFRKEVIQKGIIYLNIFPYVIWEMQDAINDCNAGSLADNTQSYCSSSDAYCGQSVHAWDEAVAFFAGSLESATKGGVTGYSGGYLQYYLADKRCENFGTCTASYDTNSDVFSGESKINEEIIALFQRGETEISAAVDITTTTSAEYKTKCDIPAKTMEEIATKMLVPFIQGTIRYLHKTSTASGRSAKQAGELFAFASTLLPFIHAVDPAAATMLYTHVWEMPADPANDLNTVATIKSAIEATYPKLGFGAGIGTIKCSDIGSLHNGGNLQLSGCIDAPTTTVSKDEVDVGLAAGLSVVAFVFLVTTVAMCYLKIRVEKKYEAILLKQPPV